MNDASRTEDPQALAQALTLARQTVERQRHEIESLQRRITDERFAEELKDALTLAASTGAIAAPVTHSRLLEMIVETSAHVISARAAALFLVDEQAEELIFEVALGEKAEEVRKFRVPLGHGIAGLVAVSGQPMAVSGAESDPRQASDIAQSVGYKPQSILCVPLFHEERVTGVLELLDKEGAASFSALDMEDLSLFANQAAVAIEQSRTTRNLGALLGEVVQTLGEQTPGEQALGEGVANGRGEGLGEKARDFAGRVEEDDNFRKALEMAGLVREISHRGEDEQEGCKKILLGFAEYLRTRREPGGELGSTF